jgi:hypothetical protein
MLFNTAVLALFKVRESRVAQIPGFASAAIRVAFDPIFKLIAVFSHNQPRGRSITRRAASNVDYRALNKVGILIIAVSHWLQC